MFDEDGSVILTESERGSRSNEGIIWDGGEGDDIIWGGRGSDGNPLYLGGNGDDTFYPGW